MSEPSWLLLLHIASGALALLTALVAFSVKQWDGAHRWHMGSGRVFFASMAVVFFTAVPLAIFTGNIFLFFIGIFSFYLAWSGWRYAHHGPTGPEMTDRIGAGLMAVSALLMIGYGTLQIIRGDYLGIVLTVFGLIGGALAVIDLRSGGGDEQERIAAHLTRMMAATIATITAFLVTNVEIEPKLVLWLAPTIVMTPLIYWWNKRIRTGFRPRGMP